MLPRPETTLFGLTFIEALPFFLLIGVILSGFWVAFVHWLHRKQSRGPF
jgi:hypothetical protein